MRRTLMAVSVAVVLIAAACGDSGGETTTTAAVADTATPTTAPPPATQPPATTQPTTTTVPATTTTAAVTAFEVPPTPVSATLSAYNEGGEGLFDSGSVEAHWYQWDGFYVVLYRGLVAAATGPLCAGNSIRTATGFEFISNSPVPVGHDANAVCVDVPSLASGDHGTIQCGSLVAYLTDIPTTAEGALFGTVEFNDGSGFIGHTSSVQSDIANTPEFDPGAVAYNLPPTGVDEGGTVIC